MYFACDSNLGSVEGEGADSTLPQRKRKEGELQIPLYRENFPDASWIRGGLPRSFNFNKRNSTVSSGQSCYQEKQRSK